MTTTIQGVFEAGLLKYIQTEVDQLAEGIRSWEQTKGTCSCSSEDWTCMCDTATSIDVDYNVPRGISRFGYKTWYYNGDFYELIRMLDEANKTPPFALGL